MGNTSENIIGKSIRGDLEISYELYEEDFGGVFWVFYLIPIKMRTEIFVVLILYIGVCMISGADPFVYPFESTPCDIVGQASSYEALK